MLEEAQSEKNCLPIRRLSVDYAWRERFIAGFLNILEARPGIEKWKRCIQGTSDIVFGSTSGVWRSIFLDCFRHKWRYEWCFWLEWSGNKDRWNEVAVGSLNTGGPWNHMGQGNG